MKKIKLCKSPWVTMKDNSYEDCLITLVYEWMIINSDETTDDMGIIVIQPKNPKDSHPFTRSVKLSELSFVAFGVNNENFKIGDRVVKFLN